MYILSIVIGGHDASISLMEDDKIVLFLAEERISRVKRDANPFLISLKKIYKITQNIDYLICMDSDHPNLTKNYSSIFSTILKKYKINVKNIVLFSPDNHHQYHASSGFYESGFKEATCIVIDGFGGQNKILEDLYATSTTSIFKVKYPYSFKKLYSREFFTSSIQNLEYQWQYNPKNNQLFNNKNREIFSNYDIGLVYSSICTHLGWDTLDGGKLMGLSSYGKKNPTLPNFVFKSNLGGDMNLFATSQDLNLLNYPNLKLSRFNYNCQQAMDLAYKAQKLLEEIVLFRVNQAIDLTNCKNIVLSGGIFMNVVVNYLIKKHFPKINFYIDPIANDTGLSKGISYLFYSQLSNPTQLNPLKDLYWGPSYSKENLLNSIKKYV